MKKKLLDLYQKTQNRGQTIIELLIATLVVGTVVTGVAISLSYNIKRNAEILYRESAATYAQQTIEMFKRERERMSWEELYEYLQPGVHCMNNLPTEISGNLTPTGECESFQTFEHSRTDFQREITISRPDTGTIELMVKISWHAGDEDETSTTATHRMKKRLN